ncbi:hypothetical protein Aduo_008100 [Ancylostoma duodenale]
MVVWKATYGFQFTSSQFVHFECQVKPCVHSCRRQQCEGESTTKVPLIPALRKRREEADRSSNLTTLRMQTVLQIEPQQVQRAALVSQKNLDHCVSVNEVLFIAMLVLGAVFALAILLCFVCSSSKRQIRTDEPAYSVAHVFQQ